MDIAAYQAKQYGSPPCWELVVDVLSHEFAATVPHVRAFRTVKPSVREIAAAFRLSLYKAPAGWKQCDMPEHGCLVLMGRSERLGFHHVGIYVDGSVLHAEESGTLHQDIASLGDKYRLMEFWAWAP